MLRKTEDRRSGILAITYVGQTRFLFSKLLERDGGVVQFHPFCLSYPATLEFEGPAALFCGLGPRKSAPALMLATHPGLSVTVAA